jgi:enoyl-CoA hydratase/carnithine racemase
MPTPDPEPQARPVTEHLEVGLDGAVATVRLARPQVLNALSVDLLEELAASCRWLAGRDDVRVVVLRGDGPSFSAGADLSTLERLWADDGTARAAADAGHRAASALEALPQVSVAAIHGRCVGGAVVLALACDLRVCADDAVFSIPEVDLGIPLAWGGIPRLLREVGPGMARDLVLSCRSFGADEALAVGLVSRSVPSRRFDAEVAALAAGLATKARLPVRATLDAIAAAAGIGTPQGWSDADSLLAAVRDPEALAAGAAYLARVTGRASQTGSDGAAPADGERSDGAAQTDGEHGGVPAGEGFEDV